jgi:hypothetical protein
MVKCCQFDFQEHIDKNRPIRGWMGLFACLAVKGIDNLSHLYLLLFKVDYELKHSNAWPNDIIRSIFAAIPDNTNAFVGAIFICIGV